MAEEAAAAAAFRAFQENNNGQLSDYSEASQMVEWTHDMNNAMGSQQALHEFDELQLMQSLHLDVQEGRNVEILQELISIQQSDSPDEARAQHLLSLLEQQHQQQLQQTAMEEEVVHQRPTTHYFTISQNGMILEATQTVTGFAPEDLLMTSVYDALFEDDRPGFLAIKAQFWDRGNSNVEVFIRRRTIEGDWIWMVSKAVCFINNEEIHGIILEESVAPDEEIAIQMNRIIRIMSILIQASEAAFHAEANSAQISIETREVDQLNKIQQQRSQHGTNANQATIAPSTTSDSHIRIADFPSFQESGSERSIQCNEDLVKFDPNAIIEEVRKGVALDLGTTALHPEEVSLLTLVLTGRIPVREVGELVNQALRMGQGIRSITDMFELESEKVSSRHGNRAHIAFNYGARYQAPDQTIRSPPPPISVLNLSYTFIGNHGIDVLSEVIFTNSSLLTIDISFCNIDEKGFSSFSRAIVKRRRKGITSLKGIILTGNYISIKSAREIGASLAPSDKDGNKRQKRRGRKLRRNGYETDSAESDDDDNYDADFHFSGKNGRKKSNSNDKEKANNDGGLKVLHVANTSMSSEAVRWLLEGLGTNSKIQELNLSSNNFGTAGAEAIVNVLEPPRVSRNMVSPITMPLLARLDISNNDIGDNGTKLIAKSITVRNNVYLVDLRFSSNSIGPSGCENLMKYFPQNCIISLSLDKNLIGDQGCQIIAASLPRMTSLSRLNLGFNQIGSRGITSLMRSLVDCESLTYLGLSGNILRITGAIALSFALLQHPHLEELDLDNCCLGQAAQCHIVAGIISNKNFPMLRLQGYAIGPPLASMGAIEPHMANRPNDECLRFRKNEQMQSMFQWMEDNRNSNELPGQEIDVPTDDPQNAQFLNVNDLGASPWHSPFLRFLGWLSRVLFDPSELNTLQKYFYGGGGGDSERGSDGHINLKLRGDLLAALNGEAADEGTEEFPMLGEVPKGSVGLDLEKLNSTSDYNVWNSFAESVCGDIHHDTDANDAMNMNSMRSECHDSFSELNASEMDESGSVNSSSENQTQSRLKPRIMMFPRFEQQLAELRATATEMIEQDEDQMHHEVILTQYAEASLTILRQLRYRCMKSGLDGWRESGAQRKVLIVDDSDNTRKMVSRAFEKANFTVDTASNGQEGVEKLKTSLYDIAFMDIDMPIMNGFEATKQLRDWEDNVRPGSRQPICALTATYVDDFERSELMKFKDAGIDVMESKPCNIPRLLKVVDDVSPMFSDLRFFVQQTS